VAVHYEVQVRKDYQRDVWCLLGMPVDRISMEQTIAEIAWYTQHQKHAVLSTINVNWLVTSLSNLPFRLSVLDSDICTIDGKYLIFLSKLLGLPFQEVVAGSTLAFHLKNEFPSHHPKLKMYLFGGDENVGKIALEKTNHENCRVHVVGEQNPGFGPVETKSSPEIIDTINASEPDFILVALGAVKGQEWIQRNKYQLNAAVISHLGATINFLAGTIKRAPEWVQNLSFEWAWRILSEPHLYKRYRDDALIFFSLIIKEWKDISYLRKKEKSATSTAHVSIEEAEQGLVLKLEGDLTAANVAAFKDSCQLLSLANKDVSVDISGCRYLSNQNLAVLLLLAKHKFRQKKQLRFVGTRNSAGDILKTHRFDLSLKSLGFEPLQ